MKYITVFFDFEAWWESPQRGYFDLRNIIKDIEEVLDRYKVAAVFNSCGAVADEFPDMVKGLYNSGHEIASHGYRHENFNQLSADDLNSILRKTEVAIYKTIKEKPIGIRSPGLFYNKLVYDVIKSRNYKWVSNSHSLLPEMFKRPDSKSITHFFARVATRMNNHFLEKRPYYTNGLLEIPLLSSLETDLLNILPAHQKSSGIWLRGAFENLKKQYKRSKGFFNLNFHPWFIGSSNRIILLKNILAYVSAKKGNKFVLAKEMIER